MRTFVVLICSVALVCVAYAQPEQNKGQKKKQPQTAQHGPTTTTGAGAGPKKTSTGGYQAKKGQTSTGAYEGQKGKKGKTSTAASEGQTGKAGKGGKVTGEAVTTTTGKTAATGAMKAGKTIKPEHFDLPKQPNIAKAPPVKFQSGKHIEGSEKWQGSSYVVFRNYTPEWHDQGWWHSHYNNIVFVFGAPYYWNAGYWFPAWGYAPNAYYAWDGPIYGHGNLPPDQVVANVQRVLHQQPDPNANGKPYYPDEPDGLLGPETRGALGAYQRDHGLTETGAIDDPTLKSLGLA